MTNSTRWCTIAEYADFKNTLIREAGGNPVCYYDNKPIDLKLSGRAAQSFSIDHLKPKQLYPALAKNKGNMVAARKSCNSSKGTQTAEKAIADKARKSRGTREEWR